MTRIIDRKTSDGKREQLLNERPDEPENWKRKPTRETARKRGKGMDDYLGSIGPQTEGKDQ